MKAGRLTLFFVTAAIFAVVILGAELEDKNTRFSRASCNFTLNFLQHAAKNFNSSNVIFSPVSISILLAILQQGAKGNTLAQLEKVLSLTADESRNGFFNFTLLRKEKNVQLDWGNRCYIKRGLKLNEDFQSIAIDSFDVGVEELDFKKSTPQDNVDLINKWVANVTHHKITDIIDSSKLNPNTVMLLINAIFFRGHWLRPFRRGKTVQAKFETTANNLVNVLFMFQRGKFYSDKNGSLGAKWVLLPFHNERFAMIFVLPTKKHQLNDLISKLSDSDLYHIFSYRGVSYTKVRLPKFRLSEKVSLVNTLKQLGLTELFSADSNLSGVSSEKFQVSDIIHQAGVEIDERGSSSSAATVVEFLRMRPPTLTFNANQPFLFFVIDTETKVPLFAGKIVNPTA